MTLRAYSLIAAAIAFASLNAFADEEPEHPSIIDHVQADSIIFIEGPDGLLDWKEHKTEKKKEDNRVYRPHSTDKDKTSVYYVQVFSDGNARTAKAEAYRRAGAIQGRFGVSAHVSYSAPYWRVRVGEFHNPEDAQQLANRIRGAFPSYGREVRVVGGRRKK